MENTTALIHPRYTEVHADGARKVHDVHVLWDLVRSVLPRHASTFQIQVVTRRSRLAGRRNPLGGAHVPSALVVSLEDNLLHFVLSEDQKDPN